MAFGFGTGYCGLQAIFSFFLKELPGSNIIINIIRIVMSVLQVAFLTYRISSIGLAEILVIMSVLTLKCDNDLDIVILLFVDCIRLYLCAY
jgi:hypothetical protein